MVSKNLALRALAALCAVSIIGTGGCKHSTEPQNPPKIGMMLPFGILPAGVSLDGGWFSTLSGTYEGHLADSAHGLTAQVALSYHDWPGAIAVKLDGSSLTDYISDVNVTGHVYSSRTWDVDSNAADSIPTIHHVIRAIDPLEITGPYMFDSVSGSFTVTWTTTSDTNSNIAIFFTATPPALDSTSADTIGTTVIPTSDVGTYTFPSSMFTGIPTGFRIRVFIIRYVLDIESINSKNYAFLNGFQRGAIFYKK